MFLFIIYKIYFYLFNSVLLCIIVYYLLYKAFIIEYLINNRFYFYLLYKAFIIEYLYFFYKPKTKN
jgi:hypothetical protein